MLRVRSLSGLLAGCLACASGGSKHVETAWKDPGVSTFDFHRVLVSYITTDTTTRRRVEDKLASRIPNSFAASRVVPALTVQDKAAATAMLREKLFDAAIVIRVVDVNDKQTYVPTSSWYSGYQSFYGYWGASWGMVQRPGYVVNDRMVSIETAVYSLRDDKLLWAGRSVAMNASSSTKLMDESADRVLKELRNQRLIE